MVTSTNQLSVGEGWFEGIAVKLSFLLRRDEVYETGIEVGFLSN